MLINQTNKFVKDFGIVLDLKAQWAQNVKAHGLKLYDNLMNKDSQRPKSPKIPRQAGHDEMNQGFGCLGHLKK